MYEPGYTSQLLNIPSSTLRRYVAKFGPHLSPSARRKRNRLFTDGDLTTLGKIRDLASQGVPVDEISAHLPLVVDEFRPEEQEQDRQTGLAIFRRFQEYDSHLDNLRDEQRRMNERLQRLEEFYALPWWRRIFKRPPD